MAKKIISFLLVALIISLGFGQLLRFELIGIPIYFHDFLTVAILFFMLPSFLRHSRLTFTNFPLWFKLVILGLGIGTLRAAFLFPSSTLVFSSLYALRLLTYLTLFFALSRLNIKISPVYFLLSGLIALVIGLGQYFLLPDMRVFQYLGWDDHLNRLTLPHFDPAFSGAFFALALLFLYSFSINSLFVGALLLIGVLLTYSRSIWLALTLSFLLATKKKLLTLVIIFLLSLGAYLLLPQRFGEGTNLLRTYSIVSRLDTDFRLAKNVGWGFVTGIGYNSLTLAQSPPPLPNHARSFNNSFLTILSASGFLGLAGWFLLFRFLWRFPNLRLILIFLILGSFFNNLLLYPFILLWVLLLILTVPNAP